MSHQNNNAKAYVTSLGIPPESHHNKPEEHKEEDDFRISLEEALLGE